LGGLQRLGAGLAKPAATLKGFEELLEAEGDDEADAHGDEVEKHRDRLLRLV